MKLKAKRKNSLIELETESIKLINFLYYFLKILRFEIKYIDWNDEND